MTRRQLGLGVGGGAAGALPGLLQPGGTAEAATGAGRVQEACSSFTLSNGMRFVVLQRSAAPLVSFHTYADVGAADEPDGLTGLAHLLEHCAFKGTAQIGTLPDAGALDRERAVLEQCDDEFYAALAAEDAGEAAAAAAHRAQLKELQTAANQLQVPNAYGSLLTTEGGVGLNASTSQDSTQYYLSLPANKLELWMAVEASRWTQPVFRELYSEKEVIKEERRMAVENSRLGRFTESFLQQSFASLPYGRPVIGTVGDFERLGRREVEAFFRRRYRPDRLTCALVGDVDPVVVRRLATQYFGDWSPQPPTEAERRRWDVEWAGDARDVAAAVGAPATFEMTLPAGPYLMEGYYRPGASHPDALVVEVLGALLSSGRSARLYRDVVETGDALYASCYDSYPSDKYPSLFVVSGVPANGKTPDDLAERFRTQLRRLAEEPVTEAELQLIKKSTRVGLLEAMASNSTMASLLCEFQALRGDYRTLFIEPARVEAITAADVQRVAADMFRPQNRVTGVVRRGEASPLVRRA